MIKNKLSLSIIGIISIILLIAFTFASPIIDISSPADSSIQSSESVNLNYGVSEPVISCSFSLDGGAEDTSIVTQNYSILSSIPYNFGSSYPHSVYVDGDFVYTFITNGISIVNATDKSNPTTVSNFTNASSMAGGDGAIVKEGNFVYRGATTLKSFVIIDVSDPLNPFQVSFINDTGKFPFSTQIVVTGDYAYVVHDGAVNYLTIVNVTDKSNPSVVSSLSNASGDGANGVYATENFVYTNSWSNNELKVIDATDKANPVKVGSLFDPVALLTLGSVDGDDNYSYIGSGDAFGYGGTGVGGAVIIVDVNDKSNPFILSVYNGSSIGYPLKVIHNNDYVSINSQDNGSLTVIDVSDPINPTLVSSIDGLTSAYGLDVQDTFAYVELSGGTLKIVDISADTQNVILTPVAQGGHSLTLTCSDWEDVGQSSHNFQVIIPQFAGQIQGEGELFEILQSSGAGLGTFIQFMGVALPTLIIGIMFVGIIVLIGFAIVTIINKVMLKPE